MHFNNPYRVFVFQWLVFAGELNFNSIEWILNFCQAYYSTKCADNIIVYGLVLKYYFQWKKNIMCSYEQRACDFLCMYLNSTPSPISVQFSIKDFKYMYV